jgi:plasmid stability protein
MHNAIMPNVMIRDLDPRVHAALVARAENEGRSLQQFLTRELTRLIDKPTLAELFDEIEARNDGIDIGAGEIVDAIHHERRRG